MLEAFLQRLIFHSKANYNNLSNRFKNRISEDEYKNLFEKLIIIVRENTEIRQILTEHGKYRFKKEDYELPRTIQVLTDTSKRNLFALIEAKSKISGGAKYSEQEKKNRLIQGSSKKMYFAFNMTPEDGKVGDSQNVFTSLAFYRGFTGEDEIKACIEEADISNQCKSGLPIFYSRYQGKEREKLSFYSKFGLTLKRTFLKSVYTTLSNTDKKTIFSGILDELYHLHKNKIIHQDLKPDNIIIFQDPRTGTISVKITDFGSCSKLVKISSATAGYESPEMYFLGALKELYPENYKSYRTLSMLLFNLSVYNKPDCTIMPPNCKNDMWSLGVVYLQLMYLPELRPFNINKSSLSNESLIRYLIEEDDILSKLLVSEEKRYSIEELDDYIELKSDTAPNFKQFINKISVILTKEELKYNLPDIMKQNISLVSEKLCAFSETNVTKEHTLECVRFTLNLINRYQELILEHTYFFPNLENCFIRTKQFIKAKLFTFEIDSHITKNEFLETEAKLTPDIVNKKASFYDSFLKYEDCLSLFNLKLISQEFENMIGLGIRKVRFS